MVIRIVVFLLFSLNFVFTSNSKGSKDFIEPSWVYLKKAENFLEQGDYSNAMTMARIARQKKIDEELKKYWDEIYNKYREKTNYELTRMKVNKEQELKINDLYPQYHKIMGDIYYQTDFLEEAEREYRIALEQKDYLDYKDQILEIKYSLAKVYNKMQKYDLEDIVYREIIGDFFNSKNREFWDRFKYNIKNDITLKKVFMIYRIEGIKYLNALYYVGRREALMKRFEDSLFYLSLASIVWMTYYGDEIKKNIYDFQYAGIQDFVNYIKNSFTNEEKKEFIIDKILFYIGYNYFLNREYDLMNYYFNISKDIAKQTGRFKIISDQIKFLEQNRSYNLNFYDAIY